MVSISYISQSSLNNQYFVIQQTPLILLDQTLVTECNSDTQQTLLNINKLPTSIKKINHYTFISGAVWFNDGQITKKQPQFPQNLFVTVINKYLHNERSTNLQCIQHDIQSSQKYPMMHKIINFFHTNN